MVQDLKSRIKEIVFRHTQLSENSLKQFISIVSIEELRKDQRIVDVEKKNLYEYFIFNGVCRSFLFNPEGEDITLSFFAENDVISPHITRTKKNISLLNIETLTPVILGKFNAADFLQMMIDNKEIRLFANTVLQNELLLKAEKEINNASLPAKERLISFRDRYGDLENRIPHTHIASYLGITNISLSRLRKELTSR